MAVIMQLLFPGCSTQVTSEKITGNERRFSSALAHLATSLAVAIIIGVSSALAAYFLTHGVNTWTAVAGGGSAVVSGFVTYVILRCAFSKTPQHTKPSPLNPLNEGNDNKIDDHHPNESMTLQQKVADFTSSAVHSKGVHRSNNNNNADVKGTVYIISQFSGPIRHDRRFEFAKRLQSVNSEPIKIKEDDIYLKLQGEFETGLLKEKFHFLDKNELPLSHIYLPSCLFEGIKEGDTVRFFYDGKLIELTCKQATHPHPQGSSWTFEGFLDSVKARVQYDRSQALWNEDVEGEPKFMGELVGQTLVQLNSSINRETTQVRDFQFYEEDQKKYGSYQKLPVVMYHDNVVFFYIHRDYQIDISDIVLIESKGFNGLHQAWILIPHKPEKNQFPEGVREITCGYGDRKQKIYRDSFNPQKGDRISLYRYGQYFMCPLRNSKQVRLSFDESGWLKLTIES